MSGPLDRTHDREAASWLDSANAARGDFPIQNLPIGVFRRAGSGEAFRGGIAIGDQVVDLAALAASGMLVGAAQRAAEEAARPILNDFLALGREHWRALRHALFDALHTSATPSTQATLRAALVPQQAIEHALYARIGDYTDFYTSLDHALNVGRIFRPDADVAPNFRWMPIAYHGRVSTIGTGLQRFRRPMGQAMAPGAAQPSYGPSRRLDFELELGIVIGPGNAAGEPIAIADAEAHVFGICLLNDWSARDIQFWEMTPLGPFLGKNFATTISPWIVDLDALAPYRLAPVRPAGDPAPLPYLDSAANREAGALDIRLEVRLESARARAAKAGPTRISATSFRHQYWTVAQMVAHHSGGGCALQPGDLFGSGTISGPTPGEAGAIIELTKGGTEPLALDTGETRRFLEDGDAIELYGWCEKEGFARIGFGSSRGEVLSAIGIGEPT